jgi:hypothetical protein
VRELTLRIYCKNDEPLLGLCCINILNVTDGNDFEGLLYEAFCKTTARKNPIRRTGLRDRRSRYR